MARRLRRLISGDVVVAADGRRWHSGNVIKAILAAILVVAVVREIRRLVWRYPKGVDLEIPLRAAERWLTGGDPYPAAAFHGAHGVNLPFLYPPFVLPILAPFTFVPRPVVIIPWLLLLVAVAYLSARRLGFGPVLAGLVLLWPPYLEALMGGNIQILLFGAFAALLYRDGGQLDPRDRERPAVVEGVLGAFVAAVKVSQVQAWIYVLRRRPPAAMIGLAVFALVALVMLPLVGIHLWFDWLAQAGRAGDPKWPAIGFPLSRYLGQPVGLALTVMSVVAVFFVPPRQAGAWIGILMVLGAPSLHIFGLLFLLPAMRLVRREIGLLAAILVATYAHVFIWAAVAMLALSLLAPRLGIRFTLEPLPAGSLPDATDQHAEAFG